MPELRDYLRSYWKQRWLIGGLVAVTMIVTYATAAVQPTKYAVTQSFAINRADKQSTPDYQYDGYYALQAADLFAQTVVSWFQTPPILQQIYTSANLDIEAQTANDLPARFKVKKYSAQNIVVRFQESTPERAKTLAAAVKKDLEQRSEGLNQSADGHSVFTIVGQEPTYNDARPPMALLLSAAFVVSAGCALLIAALRQYLGNA
jgi:uncharacterized protein involved in exopolysaccharide biosynthesis